MDGPARKLLHFHYTFGASTRNCYNDGRRAGITLLRGNKPAKSPCPKSPWTSPLESVMSTTHGLLPCSPPSGALSLPRLSKATHSKSGSTAFFTTLNMAAFQADISFKPMPTFHANSTITKGQLSASTTPNASTLLRPHLLSASSTQLAYHLTSSAC